MRTVRGLAAIGLVVPPSMLLGGPALAATPEPINLVVDRSSWSWRSQTAALPAREPSLVPAGRLAVAWDGQPGVAAKATYLHLDLPAQPAGAGVGGLTLTLPLDVAADQVDPGGIRLVACRLLADFPAGEAADPATMPEEDCTDAPVGEYDDAAGTWSFAATGFGRSWLGDPASNHGVVVRPAPDYAVPTDLPFQLVFAGAGEIRAQLLVTHPSAAPAPIDPAPPAEAPPVLDLGSGFVPPSTGDSTFLPPLVTAPAPQAAEPAPVDAPVTAAPPAALSSTPSTQLAAARTSSGAVALLAGAVGVLLLAVARVAGNTSGPAAFARAERAGLDRIRLRAPAAATAVVDAPPAATLPAQVPQRRQGRRPISSATSTVT